MENTELERIYSEGHAKSHLDGLRAVFDAGVKWPNPTTNTSTATEFPAAPATPAKKVGK